MSKDEYISYTVVFSKLYPSHQAGAFSRVFYCDLHVARMLLCRAPLLLSAPKRTMPASSEARSDNLNRTVKKRRGLRKAAVPARRQELS